jgi:hypothetical protein
MAQRIVAWILGGGLIGVAALMLVSPATWYQNHPGVADHGPLNEHFVRDIACANLVVGAAIILAILIPGQARTLLAGATAFLSLHAIIHLSEWLFDHGHSPAAFGEAATVYLPVLLSVWLLMTAHDLAKEID